MKSEIVYCILLLNTRKTNIETMKINKTRTHCSWCGRKSVGTNEIGFKSCVKCDYNSNKEKRKISLEEELKMSTEIYEFWICGQTRPNNTFPIYCTRYKGHKGDHMDSQHPTFKWE